MAQLVVENLGKFYKDVCALKNISFKVKRGEFVSIIGRSGAGKSTLLRCINRMIDRTSGSVYFDGIDVYSLSHRRLRQLRARIGMIFQHYNLVYRQTVIENVLHGRLGYKNDFDGIIGRYTEEEKRHAVAILEKLDLLPQMYKRCDTLSGGQKQRVGIARALIQDPELILCDEPISSLDPSSAKVIMDHLRSISHEMGITVLVNLHQVDVAIKYSDRILGIHAGELVFDGEPEKLKKKIIYEIYGTEEGSLVGE
ncbi:MAG: phosphonate ABC transporter ATP-binding protein [Treponemataceae bacterium]|nr:phosphonate ABC transporter ATP-binding protein [Treponemataceae bacterium]